jgi:putative transposase
LEHEVLLRGSDWRGGSYHCEVTSPIIPHRKNVRLQGYDYSVAGGYYVTIVTQGRECLFGEIQNEEKILNEAGKMVAKWWNELPNKFPSVTVDVFVVMPNHFHGIIFIHDTVGADRRVGPGGMGNHDGLEKGDRVKEAEHIELGDGLKWGEHAGSPLQNDGRGDGLEEGAHVGVLPRRTPQINAPLSQIVQWSKTMTTNEYIRGVKELHWRRFIGKLWQRNYFEHIIRNEEDYKRIFNYIVENPSKWAEDEENR